MGTPQGGAKDLRRLADEALRVFHQGDNETAKEALKELEAAARAAGNGLRLQEALMYLGILRMKQEDWDGALVRFKEQESICRELELRPFLVMALGNQALVLAKSEEGKKAEEALALFEEIESMCREEGDEAMLCQTLTNKARLLYDRDVRHERARDAYREAAEIARRLEDRQKLAISLAGLAESLGEDDIEEIRGLCEEALPLAEECCPPFLSERLRGMLDYVRFADERKG